MMKIFQTILIFLIGFPISYSQVEYAILDKKGNRVTSKDSTALVKMNASIKDYGSKNFVLLKYNEASMRIYALYIFGKGLEKNAVMYFHPDGRFKFLGVRRKNKPFGFCFEVLENGTYIYVRKYDKKGIMTQEDW